MLGEIIFLLLEFTILQIVRIDHRSINYIYIYIQYVYIYIYSIYIYIYTVYIYILHAMYMLCIIYTVRRSSNLIGFVTLVLTLPLDRVRSGGCWRTLIPLSRALGWWLRRIVGQTIDFWPQSSVKTMFFSCFLQVSD